MENISEPPVGIMESGYDFLGFATTIFNFVTDYNYDLVATSFSQQVCEEFSIDVTCVDSIEMWRCHSCLV